MAAELVEEQSAARAQEAMAVALAMNAEVLGGEALHPGRHENELWLQGGDRQSRGVATHERMAQGCLCSSSRR